MAACADRQLSEAQRQAGTQQQRGTLPGIRPFTGTPTPERIADYLNRELFPLVKQARNKLEQVFLPVIDSAPSANPLAYYFSVDTTNADPTSGFLRLDNATQESATTIRISQSNGRLQDVAPWLEVMSGSSTSPLGVVTLADTINPQGRFVRYDLTGMVDQGTYWDLTVVPVESTHPNPFVDNGPVVLGFIPGVASTGTTVSPGAITPIADETLLANISGGVAAPTAVPFATIDSASVIWDSASDTFQRAAMSGAIVAAQNSGATVFAGILDNGVAENNRTNLNFLSTTSMIAVVTDDAVNDELELTWQRAALTGDVTATQNSNTTAFRSFTARSVLANATNAGAVPTELQGTTANHLLKVNAAGNALVFEALALAAFPTGAADTFLGNFTAGVAVPTYRAGTSIAGGGLTYTTGGTLAVGAGTRITVNADDVQLAAGAAESFLMNATAGAAVADYRAGSSVAGAGLAYVAGGTINVGAGTNVTVNANDVAVDDFPLSGLADQAANTYLANATAGVAPPTAVAVSAESIPARTSGNLTQLTSSAQSILMRAAGSLFFGTAAADQTLRRSGSGDLGFGTLVTNNIGDDQVTFPKMVNIATDSLIGRDTAGTGDPENITLGNGLEMTGAGALRVDEDDSFLWTNQHTFRALTDLGGSITSAIADFTAGISLSQVQSTTNPLNDFSLNDGVNVLRITTAGSAWTGIVAPAYRRFILVWNTSATDQVLQHDVTSTAANRFFLPRATSYRIVAGGGAVFWYDVTSARWRVLSDYPLSNIAANTVVVNNTSSAATATTLALGNEEIIGRLNANIVAIQLGTLSGAGITWNASADQFQLIPCTQAEMETATATTTGAVTPGRQHFHPGSCKAWVNNQITTTINNSYNVSSVTDTAVGDHTINFSITFSSLNGVGMVEPSADQSALATQCAFRGGFASATTYRLRVYSFGDVSGGTAPALRDPSLYCSGFLGDI